MPPAVSHSSSTRTTRVSARKQQQRPPAALIEADDPLAHEAAGSPAAEAAVPPDSAGGAPLWRRGTDGGGLSGGDLSGGAWTNLLVGRWRSLLDGDGGVPTIRSSSLDASGSQAPSSYSASLETGDERGKLPDGVTAWEGVRQQTIDAARRWLWPRGRPYPYAHVYLDQGSPFPPSFNESAVVAHGSMIAAALAGVLNRSEVRATLREALAPAPTPAPTPSMPMMLLAPAPTPIPAPAPSPPADRSVTRFWRRTV